MFKGQCSTYCSSSKSATSCMRRLAAAAASRLDRNVGALGLSGTGLAGTFLSQESSKGYRCCTARSMTFFPTRNLAPGTTWSLPTISVSIMPRGQQFRLRSADLTITTSPTARLFSPLLCLRRCRSRNALRYSDVQRRHITSLLFCISLAVFLRSLSSS